MTSIKLYSSKNPILRGLPAFLMMVAIFLFSASPSPNVQLDLFHRIMYKGGHVIGYALLTMSYWRVFDFQDKKRWPLWILAMVYALTDEYHQSFVPGRHATLFDVAVYDNAGSLLSLWLAGRYVKSKTSSSRATGCGVG